MVRRAPAVKEGQGGPNRLASSPGSPISSPSNNRPREREVGDPSKIREWEVYWETTNLLSTHNANLSPWINESNHNCSCHKLMIINAAILAEILDVVIISYTSQHPECFCQVIRYAIWSETLRRLGLITKSKKLLAGFCLSGSFHCDPIHRKKKKSFLQVRPIRITKPWLQGQANLLFSEATCQTPTFSPHTDLPSLPLSYSISSSFHCEFPDFLVNSNYRSDLYANCSILFLSLSLFLSPPFPLFFLL